MRFEAAAGSIPGRDHVGAGRLLVGRNNQDAWAWRAVPDGLRAVVCDGCGTGARSESGALLGARLVIEALARRGFEERPEERLEYARRAVLDTLRRLAEALGGPLERVAHDHFLFTVVGAEIGPRETCLFAIGDGLTCVNGDAVEIGPYPGNAPPYLGYGLLGDDPGAGPRFEIVRRLATADLRTLLVGTDGVADLARLSGRRVPGRAEPVGGIARFWECDAFFRNPDAIRRRLALLNSPGLGADPESGEPVMEPGLLRDDTTLVVVRRTEEA